MTLQELTNGTEVILDINFNTQHFEIPSKVIGTNENGALVLPYMYQGYMIDFDVFKQRGAFFDLYFTDSTTQTRQVFKNVSVTSTQYKNMRYYCIAVNTMNSLSFESDRRGDTRIQINITGMINVPTEHGQKRLRVDIQDISEKGIAIIAPETEQLPVGDFVVYADTIANGTTFSLNFNVRVVRTVKKAGWILYGCRFTNLDEHTLAYIYFLHLDQKRAMKTQK